MRKKFQKIIVGLIMITILVMVKPNSASAALDNANIISDYNFTSTNPISAEEINNFLISEGSKLANYVIPEYIDVPYPLASGGLTTVSSRQINDLNDTPFYGKTVAQLIYDEAVEHSINPRVVLSTLQKESSAITGDVFRSSTVAAWPMFYMYDETMASCLNSGINCNDSAYRLISLDYGGIGRQLGYSIAWFGTKYSQYNTTGRPLKNGSGQIVAYEQYSDPVTIDGQSISCQTAGSRILYLYTPHIQTSFYTIFSAFFDDPTTTSAPSPIPTSNDTDDYSTDIYSADNFKIIGGKIYSARAYLGETLVADNNTTTWEVNFSPKIGLNEKILVFKDEAGTELGRKSIRVTCHKTADIDGDGAISSTDLSIFASFWGQSNPSNPLADLNGDKVVDGSDLSILATNWGK